MLINNNQAQFLEDNYAAIHRWVHYNDVHRLIYQQLEPETPLYSQAISFGQFTELDTMLDDRWF